MGWIAPVNAPRGTPFGKAGSLWSSGRHTGLDFPCPSGTVVRACAGGRVIGAGWAGAYGNRVQVRHGAGLETWYCHLSSIAVRIGQTVNPGDTLGRSGSTGNVTGPHLHLEVRRNGVAVDPAPYLDGKKGRTPGPFDTIDGTSPGKQPAGTPGGKPGRAGDEWTTKVAPAGFPGVPDLADVLPDVRGMTLTAVLVLGGFGLVAVGALYAAMPTIRRKAGEAVDLAETAAMLTPQGQAAGAAVKGAGAAKAAGATFP